MTLPPPLPLSRFVQDVERLLGRPVTQADRFGVAVSGGPDSMALLALCHAAFPAQVEAATVDHGFRPEAAEEAAIVARWCKIKAIPHATLRPPCPITGNLQSAARSERYRLLWRWCSERNIDWLLTAHHADDQLETMLMRLNRGSGVSGLAGVRGRRDRLLRPLLFWRRDELAEVARDAGCPTVQDPSNVDTRYDRAALRTRLAGTDWLDSLSASRSAAALADAEMALKWATEQLSSKYVYHSGEEISLSPTDFPREIQRRLLLRMIHALDPAFTPRGEALDQALVHLTAGKKYTMGSLLLQGGERWTVRPAPPRRKPG